jgi:hypothetical protein
MQIKKIARLSVRNAQKHFAKVHSS